MGDACVIDFAPLNLAPEIMGLFDGVSWQILCFGKGQT